MCFAHPAIMNVKPCCQIGNHTEMEDLQVKNLTLGTRKGEKKESVFWFRSFTSITAYLSSHGHSNFPKASLIKNTFWKQLSFGHQAEVLAVKDKSGLNCHPRAVRVGKELCEVTELVSRAAVQNKIRASFGIHAMPVS